MMQVTCVRKVWGESHTRRVELPAQRKRAMGENESARAPVLVVVGSVDLAFQPRLQHRMEHKPHSQEGRESSKLQADGCPESESRGCRANSLQGWGLRGAAALHSWGRHLGDRAAAEKICLELVKELLEAKCGRGRNSSGACRLFLW